MKRVFGKIYAALLLILMAAGESFVIFYFAWFNAILVTEAPVTLSTLIV